MSPCQAMLQKLCINSNIPHPPNHNIHPSPFKFVHPNYRSKCQYTLYPITSPLLPTSSKTRVQEIGGAFQFYAYAIDNTMLPSLNILSSSQSKSTSSTNQDITQVLDYAATHLKATIRYHRSDIVLHIHNDASFLCESNAKSRVVDFSLSVTNHLTRLSRILNTLNSMVHSTLKAC